MDAPTSLYDWMPRSPHAPRLRTHTLAGSTRTVLSLTDSSPPGDYPDPPVNEFAIFMSRRPARVRIRQGGRPFEGRSPRGAFVLAPAETATETEIRDTADVLALAAPAEHVRSLLPDAPSSGLFDFGGLHERLIQDKLCSSLLIALAEEIDPESAEGGLFVDHAIATLFLRLWRLSGKKDKAAAAAAKALDAATLARVTALMEERLEEAPGLADLAGEAGMEPTRFVKAFKAATGLPPHQYLLERRVERARELLTTTDRSIAEVAYACGFSSQQHLTNTFSKRLGVTPARLRKQAA